MFRKSKFTALSVGAPEYIVAGLGNPDKKYACTRHNSGFLCVDLLAQQQNFQIKRLKFHALTADVQLFGHRCLVMKPQTYMNNSGEAIRDAAEFYKIPPEKILVIFDDVLLDVGKLRIRRKGSDGGHNGIKSILYHLRSDQFPRIKVGVGKKPHPEYDLADWVLSEFKKDEEAPLKAALTDACTAISLMLNGEIDEAMNRFNA